MDSDLINIAAGNDTVTISGATSGSSINTVSGTNVRYLSAKLSACDAVRGNIFNINCFPLVAQQQAHE